MKFTNDAEIKEFLAAVDKAKGAVYLKSVYGDCYNLKSTLSKYIAIGALLQDTGENLELFCDHPDDEQFFYCFFNHNPNVLRH